MADKNLKPLLMVEDNPCLQKQLKCSFEDYDVYVAGDRNTAVGELKQRQSPAVALDLGLPPEPANATQGLATLDNILTLAPHTRVIVVTGNDKCVCNLHERLEVNRITSTDLGFAENDDQPSFNLREVRGRIERKKIQFTMATRDNHVSHTAPVLGISLPMHYSLVKRPGIPDQGMQ